VHSTLAAAALVLAWWGYAHLIAASWVIEIIVINHRY